MSGLVFSAIIAAALLHAVWNAVVKGSADKELGMASVVAGYFPLGVLTLFFAPAPDLSSLPYILGSAVLHTGYQLFLLNSYRVGDLTQVYPIARGSAPLLVAAASVLFLGVEMGFQEGLAILMIGLGIISLSIVRRSEGQRNHHAGFLALMTGIFIASYSLVDGIGAREAGTALGFYGWMNISNSLLLMAVLISRRPRLLGDIAVHGRLGFLLGGPASFLAYALVIWAFTQAPIAMVTALRETSIVFALLIGVFFLKEKLNLTKVISTFITLAGAALLRLAK
ncbi:DMT family transporter [Coralliovum pocilloporae]|uniref:DMT family transporter n=1 Tax=Coralliovum pocilloporae TaxID=3066369 RepID=UPI0033071343